MQIADVETTRRMFGGDGRVEQLRNQIVEARKEDTITANFDELCAEFGVDANKL